MNFKNILAIIFIVGVFVGVVTVGYDYYQQQEAINRWVDNSGAVHYNHPANDYEKAVEELNDYVPVFEQDIPDNDIGNVIGQTWFTDKGAIKVLIEVKDPAVVYHEMYHAITPGGGTEPDADAYATSRGFPIHDATY